MKIFKLFLPLSIVGVSVVPLVTTISCSPYVQLDRYKILPTYTGQADQLISLGIAPDYYPLQLNQSKPYEYLTNPGKFMGMQNQVNPDFAQAFNSKISSLFNQIPEMGRSWWNLTAEKNDNTNPNPEYWTRKYGDIVMYEHYLLDDNKKIIDESQSPSYGISIETNFRMSQDPYTRLPKEVIDEGLDNPNTTIPMAQELQKVFGLRDNNGVVQTMWNGNVPIMDQSKWDTSNPFYDDAYFAYIWHTQYLDNPELQPGGDAEAFSNFIINSDGGHSMNVFNEDEKKDLIIASLFDAATINRAQNPALSNGINYLKGQVPMLRHHPIYDVQTEVSEAPMFEGARRDNMLYLYQLSSSLTHKVNGEDGFGRPLNTEKSNAEVALINKQFANDPRYEKMNDALSNANMIASNLNTRLDNIKEYLKEIGANGKTFALITIAPGGGVSTIQTSSKYSFLFDRIGLRYPLPNDFDTRYSNVYRPDDVRKDQVTNSLFSMDDNGWFWNIGDGSNDYQDLRLFENTADYGVVTVRDLEYDALQSQHKELINNVVKDHDVKRENYDLWNEGLKTPFVFNMILDEVINVIESKTPNIDLDSEARLKALDWGNYWTDVFIK